MLSKIGTLVFAVICMSLISCDKNNDELQALEGVWHLHNVSGGFAGVIIDYTEGEVMWDFDVDAKEVSITNNIESTGPEQIYAGPETGAYDFSYGFSNVLEIDNLEKGEIRFKGDTLIISEKNVADGFTTIFVK